eukprot:jgi/Chrzof1/14350/UNPLg00624.t1
MPQPIAMVYDICNPTLKTVNTHFIFRAGSCTPCDGTNPFLMMLASPPCMSHGCKVWVVPLCFSPLPPLMGLRGTARVFQPPKGVPLAHNLISLAIICHNPPSKCGHTHPAHLSNSSWHNIHPAPKYELSEPSGELRFRV